MIITNKELKELSLNLAKVSGLSGVKFAFAVAKNSAKIKSELSTIQEVVNTIKGLNEYDEERKSAFETFNKTADGKKPTKEDEALLTEQIANLDEKYKDSIKEWNDLMDQEIDFDEHKIKKSNLPEDITAAQLEGILSIIDDE